MPGPKPGALPLGDAPTVLLCLESPFIVARGWPEDKLFLSNCSILRQKPAGKRKTETEQRNRFGIRDFSPTNFLKGLIGRQQNNIQPFVFAGLVRFVAIF